MAVQANTFLNKSTIIYGKSGSGKSALLREVMEKLSGIVGNVTCFSHSENVPYVHVDHVVEGFNSRTLSRLMNRCDENLKMYNMSKELSRLAGAAKIVGKIYEGDVEMTNKWKSTMSAIEELGYVQLYSSMMKTAWQYILENNISIENYPKEYTICIRPFNPHSVIIFDQIWGGDSMSTADYDAIKLLMSMRKELGVTIIFIMQSLVQFPVTIRKDVDQMFLQSTE